MANNPQSPRTFNVSFGAVNGIRSTVQYVAPSRTHAWRQAEADGLPVMAVSEAPPAPRDYGKCGECLMREVEIVQIGANGICPRCGADYRTV